MNMFFLKCNYSLACYSNATEKQLPKGFLITATDFRITPALCCLLRVKEAILSLVSVMEMVTEVVAVLPEAIPLMSCALTTTTY